MTIHILSEGLTLCRIMPFLPSAWPDGDVWIREDEINEENRDRVCAICLSVKEGKMPAPKAMKRAKVKVTVVLETGESFEGEAEEVVLAAYSCEQQIKAAADVSAAGLGEEIREHILSYVKEKAASA